MVNLTLELNKSNHNYRINYYHISYGRGKIKNSHTIK